MSQTRPKCVLILSGKGGVGKTLVAVNVALYLKDKEVKVGLLDADFSASNTGYFLSVGDKNIELSREEFKPVDVEGLQLFSIPLILGNRSVSMTGDQYSQLIRDAASATQWNVDFLVIDCPAGYGDELREAAKMYENTLLGSIIVVQPAHVLDARRALQLHKDLEMPILGLIENMSYFQQGDQTIKIFGESVVDRLGQEFGVPVFGKIPLSMQIRDQVEKKQPKLQDPLNQPILKAVEAIQSAKPQKPGFLTKIKAFIREQLTKLMIEVALSVNSEINIQDLQARFGYPGGSIIELNIMDEDMETIMEQTRWIVNAGKLMIVDESEEVTWDARIDISFNAIKWSILQNHPTSTGSPYTFQDAQRLGHMKIYGEKSMVRGAFFMQRVFIELAANQNAMQKLRPLLEVL
jgi:Mrp family chromosome partitioning ATPase